MDEVTFIIRLLSDNWSASATALGPVSGGGNGHLDASHLETPKFIDVRSIEPNEGRRVDVDSQSVLIVFEDSSNTDYPTIDYGVRNETFTFTLHIRVLHRRDFGSLTYSRDRLKALYDIARHVLESKAFRPKVLDSNDNTEASADLIKLTGRSEANDRGKRLLGYKLSVEMKRFAVC